MDKQPSAMNAEQVGRPTIVDTIGDIKRSLAEREASTRERIAYLLVAVFLGVLGIQLVISVGLSFVVDEGVIGNLKGLMEALATPVASLAGLVGFVLGYYFKASE